MSTNSNTQQINVFNKGMNTDTSDAYLPVEQYRYAENLRFLTNEGENSGELRLIEGYKKVFETKSDQRFFNDNEEILAVTNIRNYIVMLTNFPVPNVGTMGSILVIDVDKNESYRPFTNTSGGWTADHYSLVTRYEDDDNIKLYVADGESPLRAFSIHKGAKNPDSFEDISKSGGSVVFGGFGNIERTSGLMKPGIVLYAYILYTKYKGASPVSPSTKPLSVYDDKSIHEGAIQEFRTRTGFKITINEKIGSTPYEKILVYRISYTEVGLLPNIDLLYDDDLREEYYTFYDRGLEPLVSGTTFAEFQSYTTTEISANYIESKGDYLFAGGVQYVLRLDVRSEYDLWKNITEGSETAAQIHNIIDEEDRYLSFKYPFSHKTTDHWDYCDGENVSWKLVTEEFLIGDNHEYPASLLRDEIYRYGIVLYDIYGNKWPAIHIADIRTPPNDLNRAVIGNKARPIHILFTIKNLNKDLFPFYEIVRSERRFSDSHTLCQGILGRAIRNTVVDKGRSTTYYPSGFLSMAEIFADSQQNKDDENYTAVSTKDSEIFLFASPEICYNNLLKELLGTDYSTLSLTPAYTLQAKNTRLKMELDARSKNSDGTYKSYEESTFRLDKCQVVLFGEHGQKLITRPYTNKIEISSGNFEQTHPGAKLLTAEDDPTYYVVSLMYRNNIIEYYDKKLVLIYPILNLFEIDNIDVLPLYDFTIDEKIKEIKFVDSPKFNEFSEGDSLTYSNSSSIIGQLSFVNWTAAMLDVARRNNLSAITNNYNKLGIGPYESEIEDSFWYDDHRSHVYEKWAFRYPIGSGGKCALITILEPNTTGITKQYWGIENVLVASILNHNVMPYRGANAVEYTVYSSYGNYFNNDLLSHDVYDGDCYIQNFYYNAAHTWNSPQCAAAPKMSTVYVVPLETRIDMNSDSGDSYKRNKSRYIQDYEAIDLLGYNLEKPAYMYNTAYSAEPTLGTSSAVSTDDLNNNRIDYRVVYSLQKSNNETTDSWLKFMSANYLDVDTRYGEITDLRLFKNTLMFWLKDATGVLSVNERTMLQDVNDTNIILGNGDILLRYDYLTTEYGMAPKQMCETLSDTTLYWWDLYRKEILAYSGGQQVLPMKKPKTVSSLINRGQLIDKPKMSYDHKYHEVLMHVVNIPYIEYLKRFGISNLPIDGFENDFIIAEERFNRYPIVYNEIVQQFTSAYTTPFEHSVVVNGKNYMFENNDVYEWNKVGEELYPRLRYVVNANSTFTKTYDNVQLGMGESFYYDLFYNSEPDTTKRDNQPLTFAFRTIGQQSQLDKNITNREYDLRFAIPRDKDAQYGGRMRGRTMQCELTSSSSSTDFSIQYIITKYRISWS